MNNLEFQSYLAKLSFPLALEIFTGKTRKLVGAYEVSGKLEGPLGEDSKMKLLAKFTLDVDSSTAGFQRTEYLYPASPRPTVDQEGFEAEFGQLSKLLGDLTDREWQSFVVKLVTTIIGDIVEKDPALLEITAMRDETMPDKQCYILNNQLEVDRPDVISSKHTLWSENEAKKLLEEMRQDYTAIESATNKDNEHYHHLIEQLNQTIIELENRVEPTT